MESERLTEECHVHFGTRDLYEAISVKPEATLKEIKNAYFKISRQIHPDKVRDEDKEGATEKFKVLSNIYKVLTDGEAREYYDETGDLLVDKFDKDMDWNEYWRLIFPKMKIGDIDNFVKGYKDSVEELSSVRSAYKQGHGDMGYIVDNVMAATEDDVPRFTAYIEKCIAEGILAALKGFKGNKKQLSARKKKAEKEAAEAAELSRELGLDSEKSLVNALQRRKQERSASGLAFLNNLEAKYCTPPKQSKSAKKGGKKEEEMELDESSEEEVKVVKKKVKGKKK